MDQAKCCKSLKVDPSFTQELEKIDKLQITLNVLILFFAVPKILFEIVAPLTP